MCAPFCFIRDIKAGNILVDDDGTVLLGDFGVGVYLGDGSEGPDVALKDAGPPKAVQVLDDGKRKSFVGTVSVPHPTLFRPVR